MWILKHIVKVLNFLTGAVREVKADGKFLDVEFLRMNPLATREMKTYKTWVTAGREKQSSPILYGTSVGLSVYCYWPALFFYLITFAAIEFKWPNGGKIGETHHLTVVLLGSNRLDWNARMTSLREGMLGLGAQVLTPGGWGHEGYRQSGRWFAFLHRGKKEWFTLR